MNPIVSLMGDLIMPPNNLTEEEQQVLQRVEAALENEIAPFVVQNDSLGRYPHKAIQALAETGLLKCAVPSDLGGPGFSQLFSLEAQVRIARVDSAVAQIFKVHDELVREIPYYTDQKQRQRFAELILHESAVIGLAVAEAGRTAEEPLKTIASYQEDGTFLIDGEKIYTTGAAGADYIATWTFDPKQASAENPLLGFQLFLIPRKTTGVKVHEDWDALGQRATDSGKVTFNQVRCESFWRSSTPGKAPLEHASLRYQAGFSAVLTGIGIGALESAGPFVRDHSRPWAGANVNFATEDPLLQLRAGEFAAGLVSAYQSTILTAGRFDAFEQGKISRGALALSVSAAKITAHHATLAATNGLHGLMGTRSASRHLHFDRFWRNARTLSLHDPIDHKARELGNHLFTGEHPSPGVYQ